MQYEYSIESPYVATHNFLVVLFVCFLKAVDMSCLTCTTPNKSQKVEQPLGCLFNITRIYLTTDALLSKKKKKKIMSPEVAYMSFPLWHCVGLDSSTINLEMKFFVEPYYITSNLRRVGMHQVDFRRRLVHFLFL